MPSKPLGPESNRIAIDRIEVDRSSRREVGEWGVRRFGRFASQLAMLMIFAAVATWCGEPAVGQTGTPNPAEPMPGGAATGDPLAAGDDPNVAPAGAVDLQERQQRVAENYRLLEQKLFDLHEFERDQNPERSDLLRRAFEQSQQRLTGKTLETVARMIADSRLRPAEQNQTLALEDLRALLVLLESEDRDKKLREKEARIKQYIEEVDRLLKIQRGLRSQTENGVDPDRVERAEEDLADRTGNLERQFGETDGQRQEGQPQEGQPQEGQPQEGQPQEGQPQEGQPQEGQPQEGQPQEGQPQEGQPQEGQPQEGQPQEGQPQEGQPQEGQPQEGQPQEGQPQEGQPQEGQPQEGQPQEGQPQEGQPQEGQPQEGQPQEGQPQEGQPQEGQPQEGQPQEGQPQQGQPQQGQPQQGPSPPAQPQAPPDPVQQKLQQAEQKMREAQQKLEEAKREDSVEAMKQAEQQLAEARKELEEILRQLREEEIGRTLAQLEARFREMLEAEIRIYETTKRLDRTVPEQRNGEFLIQNGKLSMQQRELAVQADKALTLLLDEGSSVAFPEVVEQVRDDMLQVAQRLNAGNPTRITQEIEEDIIDSLDYLIEALVKAQQDLKQQQQQAQQMPPGEAAEQPLVDEIAELKMLRGLQVRINRRHERYSRLLDDPDDPVGTTDDPEIREALEKLSERQQQLFDITRDIVLERGN